MPKSQRAENAAEIPQRERDIQLGLDHPNWPMEGCPLGERDEPTVQGAHPWKRFPGYLYRPISVGDHPLWEVMLRFPNAPVYGLHKRPARQPSIEGRSNFHTFRVLGHQRDLDDHGFPPKRPVVDLYVLHNGLNETRDFDLHYQLASQLLTEPSRPTLCLIRPFPAHLTRYPYNDMFAERPLDTFLLDSGDLFRQFIRFMIETRWLLSILAPRSSYHVITGGKLLQCEESGDNSELLAKKIFEEWNSMDEASPKDRRRARQGGEPDVTESAIETTINVLRGKMLRWRRNHGDQLPEKGSVEPPAVHMVGYSLGGFLAQSAFFAWPYAISGSVTLFGGGELRRLAPTAFAQPEEWQSVLHSLRYELDRAMTGPLKPSNEMVQGIDLETFEYLRRVFYEVFLQYYQGSYRTRLAEFIQRMLFVTGGQDPIVKPDNILDAAPPEGVNLINIAGMSHFPTKPKERVQTEQRDFWLSQLGRIVPAFAEHADDRRLDVLHRSWLNDDGTTLHPTALEAYETYERELDDLGEPPSTMRVSSGTPLSDRWFGKEIERICGRIGNGKKGWVLVSRNEIPPVFQTEEVLKRLAAGLHHSEDLAADEFWLASKRRDALLNGRPRVTLMVTDLAMEIGFKVDPSVFPSRSETPGVVRLSKEQLKDAKSYFEEHWANPKPAAVRKLSTGEFRPEQLGEMGRVIAELQELNTESPTTMLSVRFLPDVWIGISEELLEKLREGSEPDDEAAVRSANEAAIVNWGRAIAEEWVAIRERRREVGEGEDLDVLTPNEDRLAEALKKRELTIVEFSRAGMNPRYRGLRLSSRRRAGEILVHWALAYVAAGVQKDDKPAPV